MSGQNWTDIAAFEEQQHNPDAIQSNIAEVENAEDGTDTPALQSDERSVTSSTDQQSPVDVQKQVMSMY